MLIFWLAVWVVTLWQVRLYRPTPQAPFAPDYLSLRRTTAMKGIFVLLVFLRHFKQYIEPQNVLDRWFLVADRWWGQLIVVVFLFYSGYGVMESVKRKGQSYVRTIPTQRFFKTLVHFDIVILLYLLTWYVAERRLFRPRTVLKALLAWKSVGNSNWFIFVILTVYVLTWVAFTLAPKSRVHAAALTTVLCIGAYFALFYLRTKESFWCNTILCYPLGLWYSLYHERMEALLRRRRGLYVPLLGAVAVVFLVSYRLGRDRKSLSLLTRVSLQQIGALWFALLLVLLTMLVQLDNPILAWLGKHVFSIYMLQRIFMIALRSLGLLDFNHYLYFVLCFGLTLAASELFDRCMKPLDARLFPRKDHPRITP